MTKKIISLDELKKNNEIFSSKIEYQKTIDSTNERITTINVADNSIFNISKVVFPSGITNCDIAIYNKNIIDLKDENNIRKGYLKNDSGVEVAEITANYSLYKVPVTPGENIYFNWGVQRIYMYNLNGDWIGRTKASGTYLEKAFGTWAVPSGVYFIQVQFFHDYTSPSSSWPYNFEKAQTEKGTIPTEYVESQKKSFSATTENININVYFSGRQINIYKTNNSVIEYSYYYLPSYNPIDFINSKEKTKEVDRIFDIFQGKKDTVIKINSYTNYNYKIGCRGKNILDKNTLVKEKIKNDSGTEIVDSSSYFSDMVPVVPGEELTFNFSVQRIYCYDVETKWIKRLGPFNTTKKFGTWAVPSGVYFIQVQIPAMDSWINVDIAQIEVSKNETNFEPFALSEVQILEGKVTPIDSLFCVNQGFNRIYCTHGNEKFSISYIIVEDKASSLEEIIIPKCPAVSVWRPGFITDEYKQPIGRNNVKLPMTLDMFLSTFYDKFLGTNDNGYKVQKKSIGHDSSHRYEIYEYDFIPKNYNRVIMLSSGMNPCELPAEFGIAYLMNFIMNNHNDDAGLKYLYENVRIKIVPCINASRFDTTPKGYTNYNDIRINKNFNYKNSWDNMDDNQKKGTSPDSEEEVCALKRWINENANYAELWIDCHTDPDANTPLNLWVASSDNDTNSSASNAILSIIDYYHSIGLDTENQLSNNAHVTNLTSYPKTLYAKQVCNIKAMQIEMWSNTTALGGDASYMNDSADIQFYVCFLRQLIMNQLTKEEQTKTITNMELYQAIKKTND